MAIDQFENDYSTLLNGAIDDDDTTLTIDTPPTTLTANFRIKIDDEIILVGAVSGSTFTGCSRGAEGTAAASHADNAVVTHVLTAGAVESIGENASGLLSTASALATTEGRLAWDSTTKLLKLYDGQRERSISNVGWAPTVYPLDHAPNLAHTTAQSLPANGGSLAVCMVATAHVGLSHVMVRNTDTASARAWRWDLYVNRLNDENSGEQTVDRVATSNGSESFTASAASFRFHGMVGGAAPFYIPPGIYWLVIQNTHATNTFGVGYTAPTSGNISTADVHALTKTTSNPNGSTLVLGDGTWTKQANLYGVAMRNYVFGMTSVI